jgi:hypothetical protein
MPLPRALHLLPLLTALALLAACATKPVRAGSRYIITVPKTAFYKYGPAQSFGPDTTLTQGTIVTMLESTWGYCHVMTDSGLGGYVASDDLKPAPPSAAAPPPKATLAGNARSTPRYYSGRPKQNTVRPTPGGPLFDVNDVPMPTGPLDEPPVAKPKFRY